MFTAAAEVTFTVTPLISLRGVIRHVDHRMAGAHLPGLSRSPHVIPSRTSRGAAARGRLSPALHARSNLLSPCYTTRIHQ